MAANEILRAALIDAQIAIEESEGDAARAAEDAIWAGSMASSNGSWRCARKSAFPTR